MKAAYLSIKNTRLYKLFTSVLQIPISYFKEITWENDQVYGFSFARQLWGAGWMGKIGLGLLLVTVIVSSWMLGVLPEQADQNQPVVPLTILGFGLFVYAFGWAYAQAVSVELPLWGFFLSAACLSWYGLLIGGSLAGKPAFALPILWIFLLGWWLFRAAEGKMRWVFLVLLCWGTGYLTFGALGLGKVVPEAYKELSRWTFGLVYLGIGWLALKIYDLIVKKSAHRPSPTFTFCGTFLVVAIYFGLALFQDASGTAKNALLAFQGLLGYVDLFWLWLGWTLIEGFLIAGSWGVRETMRIFRWKWFPGLFPLVWLVTAFFGWWFTGNPPLTLLIWEHELGLDAWVNSWTQAQYFTLHDLVIPSLVLSGLALLAWALRRLKTAWIASLFGIWIAIILSLNGYYESMQAFATLDQDAAFSPGVWTMLMLSGGIVWELARGGAAYWESEKRARQYALTAFLLIMLVISTITLSARLPDLVKEYTLYSFLGVVYLGIPLAIYTLLQEMTDYDPPGGWGMLGLFAFGMFSAVLVLGINSNPGLHMAIAPLVWAVVLWLFGHKLGRLAGGLDGLIAGGALGLGFVTYWMSPEVLFVPYLNWFVKWQLRYLLAPPVRPLLLPGQLWVSLGGLAAGMVIGWVFTRQTHWLVRIIAAVFTALAFGFAAPFLVAG
jgi:hypothetical protein